MTKTTYRKRVYWGLVVSDGEFLMLGDGSKQAGRYDAETSHLDTAIRRQM